MGRLPSASKFVGAFKSKEAFVEFVKVPEAPEGHNTIGKGRWSNRDLEPTPPEERNWEWYSLSLYWFTTAFGATGWNSAASLIATGMTWQQTFAAAVLGCFICAVMVVLMARPGVKYHLGFPVLSRAVMGMWGSYFFIFLRGMVCIIWYGIQNFYAANFLSICFRCMFGSSWHNWANHLPASAAVTSKQLLCFFIIYIISTPLVFIHPKKIHWLFTVKGVIVPICTFGLFGWCMAHGAGISALSLANKAAAKSATALPLGWAIMQGVNVILGSLSPMLVSQPDMSRYCKKSRDAGWIQAIALFSAKLLVLFLGLASTMSIQAAWGKAYWNMWDLLDAILDRNWNSTARAGVWFVSMAYIIASVAVNIGANSLPFGADITSLFPKWLTIVRGQILCALLGIVVQPWQLLANATKFLAFLGSYNIFMAPLCSVWIVDYIVRKGNLHVPSLYQGTKGALYWFTGGANYLAVAAWLSGVVLGLPGLVGQFQPQAVNSAALDMYRMGWLLTFFTAGSVYLVLRLIFKAQIYPAAYESMPTSFEYMAKEGRDGFFEGEREEGMIISGVSSDVEQANVVMDKGEKSARLAEQ